MKRLVVVGEAANDLGKQCGGWTITWQGRTGEVTHGGTTILTAIRHAVSSGTEVAYSPDGSDVGKADAVILVIGELPYAETKGDRKTLNLPRGDEALAQKVASAGAPVVTILLSGRPRILGRVLESSDALIAAWLPGTEGDGVADVLFGDYHPSGTLPRAWPRNNRQLSTEPYGRRAALSDRFWSELLTGAIPFPRGRRAAGRRLAGAAIGR